MKENKRRQAQGGTRMRQLGYHLVQLWVKPVLWQQLLDIAADQDGSVVQVCKQFVRVGVSTYQFRFDTQIGKGKDQW